MSEDPSPEAIRRHNRRKGIKFFVIGGVMFAAGIALSVYSAQQAEPGETYTVAGPAFGLALIASIVGLVQALFPSAKLSAGDYFWTEEASSRLAEIARDNVLNLGGKWRWKTMVQMDAKPKGMSVISREVVDAYYDDIVRRMKEHQQG